MNEHPRWFGRRGRELFGWFTLPADGRARTGVILCSSVGEEEHNAHQSIRELSALLARAGIASVRFDLHGTGDSAGGWDDPGRVTAWTRDVAEAEQALRDMGVRRIAAVGLRFGAALVGAAVHHEGVRLDDFVAWDPCGGKDLLREGYARRPVPAAEGLEGPEGLEGEVDTPGYRYSPGTAADMRALDLATLPAGPYAGRVLVLTRDDRPSPRRLRVRLDSDSTRWEAVAGQADLLDRPMTENVVPVATLERIVAWLAQGDRAAEGGRPEPVELTVPGTDRVVVGTATESVVRLGALGLVAVRTRPERPTREPVVVFINVAGDRHVGPGRRWVDLARRWAELGFEVLRMDQSGAGDSPSHAGQAFGTLYAREWLDDLPEVLDAPVLKDRPVVCVSLCSGAYSAMEAAFRRPVRAIYAINPILHARVTSKASPLGDPRRRAARPQTRPLLWLGARKPRLAAVAWRAYRQVTVWNAPAAALVALMRRGTDITLVLSPADARHFSETVYWSALRLPRWTRTGHYRLLSSPRVDHALMSQAGQEWAVRAIEEDLVERFPAREPTPPRGESHDPPRPRGASRPGPQRLAVGPAGHELRGVGPVHRPG